MTSHQRVDDDDEEEAKEDDELTTFGQQSAMQFGALPD